MRLYEITGIYAVLQAQAEAGEDVSEALSELHDSLEHKGAALSRLLRDLELESNKFGEEIDRLAARKKAIDAQRERIREYVRSCMADGGIAKIKAGTFSISLSDGPERVVVEDEKAIPPEFKRHKEEVDKSAILAAYKKLGECVPGTKVERSTRLTIR